MAGQERGVIRTAQQNFSAEKAEPAAAEIDCHRNRYKTLNKKCSKDSLHEKDIILRLQIWKHKDLNSFAWFKEKMKNSPPPGDSSTIMIGFVHPTETQVLVGRKQSGISFRTEKLELPKEAYQEPQNILERSTMQS